MIFTTPIVRGQSGTVIIATDEEALSDGFFVLLEALDAGTHVLEFGDVLCLEDGTRVFETTALFNLSVENDDDD